MVDSHTVVQTDTERAQVSCTQFPPMGTSGKIVLQYHNPGNDMDAVRCRTFPGQQGPSCGPMTATLTSLHPYPLLNPPSNHQLVSISVIVSLQDCHINGIIQHLTFRAWLFSSNMIPWRFIQVTVCVTGSFPFTAELCSPFGPAALFNRLPVEGQLGGSQCFAINCVYKAVINIHVQVFV